MSAIVGSTSIVCSGVSLIRPRFCPGALRKNGHRRDVLHVLAPHQPPVVAEPEADPVVGDHGHDGAVVDPHLVQPVEQLAEQPVGGLQLQQVALVGLLDHERDAVAGAALQPGQRLLRRAPVEAPEGRYWNGTCGSRMWIRCRRGVPPALDRRRRTPRSGPGGPGRGSAWMRTKRSRLVSRRASRRVGDRRSRSRAPLVEVAPGLGHRGQLALQVVGQHLVGVDEAEVVTSASACGARKPGRAASVQRLGAHSAVASSRTCSS